MIHHVNLDSLPWRRCWAVRRLEDRVILPVGRTFPAPDPVVQEKGKKSKARFTLR
ncbi:MAG: hypothetical protein INF93_08805 [Rhodobacter sp.]|nr:hypothetical protein [Rhodobacter sp.]